MEDEDPGGKAPLSGREMQVVQAMPGADASELRLIEQHLQSIQSLSAEFVDHTDPMKILTQIFQSTPFMIIENKPLRMECNCSRDRVERALSLVGKEELGSMLTKDGQAEVKCDFCAKAYAFDRTALETMILRLNQ